MSFGLKQSSYEAVLYVNRSKVLKEMLYSEFEAVLDQVVSEPAYLDETCHAVYLKIDIRLNIVAAVFFCIDFDKQGNADRRWNLPLLQMAESASVATELNGQGVRISCRSRCAVVSQQEHLWEPDLSAQSTMLAMLASSVKANRLGLLVEEGATDSVVPGTPNTPGAARAVAGAQHATGDAYEQAVASQQRHDGEIKRLNENIQKQRLYIASLKGRQEEAAQNLSSQFAREKEALLLQLEEVCCTLRQAQERNEVLSNELSEARQQISVQADDFERQVSANVNKQGVDFSALQKQFKRELQQKLIEQTSELKAKLDMRDVEAHYRDEQIKHLKAQLLESASSAAVHNTGMGAAASAAPLRDAVIELESKGVNFVLTLPAVRPINIPAADVDSFCVDPDGFVAARLGMDKAVYQSWIAHARNPVCVAVESEGCRCGARLEIVHPRQFVPDFSDRCDSHQGSSSCSSKAGG
ncbi:MAG: hypothetical protein HKO60_04525 [Pseudomonadales bacterium]|nr:hypothetical protein [Pseudomonadales bacterium]NNM11170.1 hypothetical protein [Pseudomonadales bacterium]